MAKINKIGYYLADGAVTISPKYDDRPKHYKFNIVLTDDDNDLDRALITKRSQEKIPMELVNTSDKNPVIWGKRNWRIFKGNIYAVNDIFTEEQTALLIYSEYDKERKLFERLEHKFQSNDDEESKTRVPIPEHVRIQVWRRDGGKCAKCGSREKLEYDHIIPVSKGGSNTARNIELLCESCNRSKGVNIE